MNTSVIKNSIIFFVLGVLFGGFVSLTVLREAIPLRSHVYMIAITGISIIPLSIALFVWYLNILKSVNRAFGTKGGNIIGTLLTFIVVTNIIVFIVVTALFFAAIA